MKAWSCKKITLSSSKAAETKAEAGFRRGGVEEGLGVNPTGLQEPRTVRSVHQHAEGLGGFAFSYLIF